MRVLLVEDDVMIGESMRTGLRQDGFNVDWVKDGLAAEATLLSANYDAMLLDLGLPRKEGMDVLKSIRAKGMLVPVLIVTARDAVPERIAGLNSGADDYIVKPFDLDELSARLRAVSRRQTGRAEAVIEHAGVVLNPSSREVAFNGQSLQLSTREFGLLEALLERPGVVFSRDQLAEKLYGWDNDVESNTIEVYIHGLRRKLGNEYIRNIRGVGYTVPKILSAQ